MSSEWGAPQTSDTPATPSNGVDALLTKLEQVKRELRDLPHGLLKQAGITVEPDRIIFGGDVRIEGTLDLPEGIIGNDALATPLTYRTTLENAFDPTITTSESDAVSATITVPSGFSQALVVADAQVALVNPLASDASVAARVYVDLSDGSSYWGGRAYQKALANADVALYPVRHQALTVVGGQTITVRVALLSVSHWGVTTGFVTINAFALFTR